jgi:hypothetical protein
MKKIIAIGAFLCIALPSVFAQVDNVRFGVQLSPALSWMSTDDNKINRAGTNLGLKLGMISEFYFRENYAFVTGIGFAFNQGGTLQYDYNGGSFWSRSGLSPRLDTIATKGVKLKYGLQYVEIPLMIKMRTREFGYIRYFLEPGLILGFRSQSRGSIIAPGVGTGDEAQKINIKRDVNGINISWGLNAGVEYSLSESTALIGGIGFQIGVVDVTGDKGTVIDSSGAYKQDKSRGIVSAINFKLGLLF